MASRYVLRFFSGKGQRGVHTLEQPETVIGRAKDVDMPIPDSAVSRRHARLLLDGDKLLLEDLGSQNGTFVNGKPITREHLAYGDWIRIGSSLMKITDGTAEVESATFDDSRATLELAAQGITGSLSELPVPDSIQIISMGGRSRTLHLTSGRLAGRIWIRDGQLRYAAIDGLIEDRPFKALYRILAWLTGSFEVVPADGDAALPGGGAPMQERTDVLMMEGMRQIDEAREIAQRLGGTEVTLAVADTAGAELTELEQSVLALASLHGTVQAVLDHSIDTDMEALVAIDALVRRNLLAPSA